MLRKLMQLCVYFMVGRPPTFMDVWCMFKEGGELVVTDDDLVERGKASVLVEYEAAKQLQNAHLSILYYRSKVENEVRESCNILVDRRSGIIIAYFTDGELVYYDRGGAYIFPPPKNRQEVLLIKEVLAAIRTVCDFLPLL